MAAGTAEAVGAGMAVVGTEAGMAAGMAAGGTVVGGTAAIFIIGVGGPATAGAGGGGADGIPTGLGANILMATGMAVTEATAIAEVMAITEVTEAATVSLRAPKVKPQRFNPGLLTSVSIMARSTARLARVQKARSKPFRHDMA